MEFTDIKKDEQNYFIKLSSWNFMQFIYFSFHEMLYLEDLKKEKQDASNADR